MTADIRKIALPETYDATKHESKLGSMIARQLGADWVLSHVDSEERVAVAVRRGVHHEVISDGTTDARNVKLGAGTRPGDGDKTAGWCEVNYPGFEMIRFQPYAGQAVIAMMDRDVSQARKMIAVAIGCKPWDVGIAVARDLKGEVLRFDLELPVTYVPSKHRDKLTEVAQVMLGNLGWQFVDNPKMLTAKMIAGEPPLLPKVAAYPVAGQDLARWDRVPIGVHLFGAEVELVFSSTPHVQVSGKTGSGKGIVIETMIAGCLARGWELAIADSVKSAIDFVWAREFCRPGGWGTESDAEALAVIKLCYEEGRRRRELIKQYPGASKWTDLPPELNVRPLLLVADEVSGMFSPKPIPKGVPKDHPLVVESTMTNLIRAEILDTITRICKEMRFVGVHVIAATQKWLASITGGSTELKSNLAAKVMLGANTTSSDRLVGLADPDAVPEVPDYIRRDPEMSRGCGVFEFDGSEPGVFKGYFASHAGYSEFVKANGVVPSGIDPRPTPDQISRLTPTMDAGTGGGAYDDSPPRRSKKSSKAEMDGQMDDIDLGGWQPGGSEMCSSCEGPIDARTGLCRCGRG